MRPRVYVCARVHMRACVRIMGTRMGVGALVVVGGAPSLSQINFGPKVP